VDTLEKNFQHLVVHFYFLIGFVGTYIAKGKTSATDAYCNIYSRKVKGQVARKK